MARRSMLAALAVVLGGWACVSFASEVVVPERARIVRAETEPQDGVQVYWLGASRGGRVAVVLREVACGAVTISRELAETPIRPFLIEVRVGRTTVYLDPNKDYVHQGHGQIDSNQFIPAAQRLWRSLVMSRARIVTSSPKSAATCAPPLAQPRAIFLRPDIQRKTEPAPGAPRPQPKKNDLLASAQPTASCL